MSGTPIWIAKNHCANYQEGICSGIDFGPKGELFRFRAEGSRCLLSSRERCSYFETAVLPIGANQEWQKKYPGEARQFEEGADQYLRAHSGIPGLAPRRRKCPDCGTQIGPKQRYCAQCRDRHRKVSNAASQRRGREKEPSPSAVTPETTIDNQRLTEAT